ncbi:hypothetical protein K461DRAFT_226262 [Myriangium duriaei CBS 260.36]|uniref:C2H2-type domain-containing protein n=1 Tax=Myriangium duriaei CBS 260.36 TaxID=1168546 RepID=A0A9P4MK56_9PEZI|nr:hypothetical protein K461DRAFT_226262 [Myriangium duriaei CBS 260.36]
MGPAYQPFECKVCQTRFTRYENLKRHAAVHSGSQTVLYCQLCSATFSRIDLQARHMEKKHPEVEHMSLESPQRGRTASSLHTVNNTVGGDPVSWVQDSEKLFEFFSGFDDDHMLDVDQWTQGASSPRSRHDPTYDSQRLNGEANCTTDDLEIADAEIKQEVQRFFMHVKQYVPFLHQPTFDPFQAPHYLVLGMLCLAYQYSDDGENNETLTPRGSLSVSCFDRACSLVMTEGEIVHDPMYSLETVQTCLLLEVCAMMYLCGDYSRLGLKLHTGLISLARSIDLTQPIKVDPTTTDDLDALWRAFVKSESHKRTLFTLHQVDALWYQILSRPRSLSHLEIKHSLPSPSEVWEAPSSTQWAHRQLQQPSLASCAQYGDSIKWFLSSDLNQLNSLLNFDPFGAINIIHFLVSSAREVTGWSTMTGRLSVDRLEPLKESLILLKPFIVPENDSDFAQGFPFQVATWRIAMIELSVWSASHTGGTIKDSIDAALLQLTHLASSSKLLLHPDTVEAIQPHVDWFLKYLNKPYTPHEDGPWLTFYAYQAFLIAWQMVHSGVAGVMYEVGIADGDAIATLAWARLVFQRRRKHSLGGLVIQCLAVLGD